VNTFIDNIITEAGIDDRINSGILDIYDPVHIVVLMECMIDRGMDELTVMEGVEAMMLKNEGKFPERQAFNKEGWLVTFPSIEYKKAAIQKGTHFESDPTHGQGGMNLYYKKRGKQKRTNQQGPSATEPTAPQGGATPPTTPVKEPAAEKQPANIGSAPSDKPAVVKPEQKPASSGANSGVSDTIPPDVTKNAPTGNGGASGGASGATPGATSAVGAGTIPTPSAPDYVALSAKFAQQKGWTSVPYGEWRNPMGEASAVVGMTGEIVPIKNVDREEFKIFAQKNGA
jgi:hypothetical protein